MTEINLSTMLAIIALLSVLFNVFLYFKTPQDKLDKQLAVGDAEVDGKAKLIAQQLQWTIEASERRFKEMQESIKDAFAFASNHTHTVEENVKALTVQVTNMNLAMTKEITILATIIKERMPSQQ